MRLSHCDHDARLTAILELHELAASGLLPSGAPRVLAKVIPSDDAAIFRVEIEPTTPSVRLTGVWEREPRMNSDQAKRMVRHFPTHPFTSAWMEHGPATALRLSDLALPAADQITLVIM